MLKTILFAFLFGSFAIGGLIEPIIGILGYMLHYTIGPERQWWHAPLNPLGFRYSLIFAIVIAISIVLNRSRLRFGKLLVGQEKLVLMLLALIWMLTLAASETIGRYTFTDHPSIKMTKVIIFCLMMTHVVTQSKDLDKVFWVLIVGSLILGLQAYNIPRRAFTGGRLDAVVGGSDFLNSNALAAFLVSTTTITGVMFMRAPWWGKLLCAVTGVFSLNTIVLCRSRGAMVALFGAGLAIVLTAPKRLRLKLLTGMVVAAVGLLYLSDPQFVLRMGKIGTHAGAVMEGQESSDRSTMMRIETWQGGLQMIKDNPLGIGPGNFNQNIGKYSPSVAGLSPHNLYIQTAAELGLPGLAIFLVIMGNALWTIRKVIRNSEQLQEPQRSAFQWTASGIAAIIVGYAACGLTGHLLYYEGFWWFLMLSVCLQRAFENTQEDMLISESNSRIE